MTARARRAATTIPAPVRTAIAAVERQYTVGDDTQYAAAVDELSAVCADLTPAQRTLVDQALVAASQRAAAAAFVARVRAALIGGSYMSVATLPGGVEVLQVHTPDLEQLLVTVPTPAPGDSPPVRERTERLRAAILAGHCQQCGADLEVATGEQLTLTHRRTCPLSDHRPTPRRRR